MLPNTDCGEGSPRHAALQQQLVVSTPGHLAASLSVSTCRGLGLPRSLLADLSGCFARTPAADMSQHAGSRPRRYGLRSRVGFSSAAAGFDVLCGRPVFETELLRPVDAARKKHERY
jgi:hypothetical protein